ncbi:hypothetical protein ACFWUZ_32120 [Streptomyces sp. NPDC058646]|uniref:hypothetical protein n=1 Tax=Streptomyces sp. NPDC058646 TaxID=3346574 RepID=UPI0036598260
MPDQNARNEDGGSTPPADGAALSMLKGAAAVAAIAAGLLIKAAVKRSGTRVAEPDRSPGARNLTPEEIEFDAIVRAVAESSFKVRSVVTNGFNVEARFRSNSGRGTWTASFVFDPETWTYDCWVPYGANAPRFFGNEVSRRMREAAAAD